tara:strand:- start:7790 stop:8656 length:867 start_codon:yes stop_codon:yes gene_type:complete
MATLTNQTVASTYPLLLKMQTSGLHATTQGIVEDGDANQDSALKLSGAAVTSTGTLTSLGDFDVNTSKFTVAGATGNSVIAGTLGVTGVVTASGGISLGDAEFIKLGVDSELQISHDGTNSIIADTGTGSLLLRASDFQMSNAGSTAWLMKAYDGGACELYHAGSKKLETTSTGITVEGTLETTGNTYLKPAGLIMIWAGSVLPTGWLWCDGNNYTQVGQPDLFDSIGLQYGEGSGEGQFNVPDLRGRVPVGKSDSAPYEALGNSSTVAGSTGPSVQPYIVINYIIKT